MSATDASGLAPATAPVRVGVVGAGTIAGLHLAAYARNPDVVVAGICDIDGERAAARASEHGAALVSTDFRAFVADPSIDAVSVCTRNDTHAEVAIAALEAGKSVLLEKPMAVTVAQAEAIVAAEAASAGSVQVGYVRRHSSNAVTLKRFVDAGDLGPSTTRRPCSSGRPAIRAAGSRTAPSPAAARSSTSACTSSTWRCGSWTSRSPSP
ncbi:Gfo/Idh/MocA family oxidoreductase [Clavibacter tessellarius]